MLNLHLYTQSLVFKVCLLWWKQFLRNSLASSVLQFWAVFFNPEGRIKLSTGEAVYTSRSRRYVTAASTADSRDPTITPLRAFPGAAALRALSPSVRAWGKGAASSVGEAGDLGAGSQTPLRFTGQTGTPRPRRLGGGGGATSTGCPPPEATSPGRGARAGPSQPRRRRTHLFGAVLALHLRSRRRTPALARLPSGPRRRGCRTGAEQGRRMSPPRTSSSHQLTRPLSFPPVALCCRARLLPLLSPPPGRPRSHAAPPPRRAARSQYGPRGGGGPAAPLTCSAIY